MANADIIVKIIDQTGTGANSVQRNLDKVSNSTSKATKGFNLLKTAALGFVSAVGVRALVGIADDIQNLDNRLKLVTGSQQELNKVFAELLDVSNKTRTPLQENVALFSRLAQANENLGLTQAELVQGVENFTKALTISGASTSEAQSAIIQFSQAMAGGVLRGEEFNAINEAAPRIMQILADQLGVTRGELRSLAEDGLLRADIVMQALLESTDKLEDEFTRMSPTIAGALTVLNNNFQNLLRENSMGEFGATVADALLLIADNLDIVIPIVGTAAVAAFGALMVAISPVAAVILGVGAALAAAGVAARKFLDDFDFRDVLDAAHRAFLNFKIGALQAIEDFVNSAISGLSSFKNNIVATFAGIGAAVQDPLNAFDAFGQAMDDSLSRAVENGTAKFVDFGESIGKAQQDLANLENKVEDTTESVEEETVVVEDNTVAIDENKKSARELLAEQQKLQTQTEKVTDAYGDFTRQLEQSAELAALDNDQRELQRNLYRALEARARDLKIAVQDLSDTERAQVEKRVRELTELEQKNRETQQAISDFNAESLRIIERDYDANTSAIKKLEDSKQKYLMNARELGLEHSQDTQDALLAYDRMIAQEQVKVAEEKHKKLIDATDRALETQMSAYDVYTQGITDLNNAMNDGIIVSDEARLAYLSQLNKEYIDSTAQEYDDLYGFFRDKLQEFTGISRKEYGLIEEIVQLTFGVNITDIFKQTFASGIQSILGFRNEGNNQIGIFGGQVGNQMGGIGTNISNTFLKTGLDAIISFGSNALSSLGGLASGIFSLFGGVGDFLGSTFGGAFKSISGAIGSLFGGGGGGGGGIGGFLSAAGTALFGPVGGFVGSLFGGLFADGGHLPAGQFGIAGEAGPELIKGPADIFSNEDSMGMLGGSNINVNFSINTIDARGFDELLTTRRSVITDLVRSAVEENPTRTLRGVR